MGLMYIFGALLLLIVIWVTMDQLRLRKLRHQRQGKGFSRERFIKAFRELGIPENIPATVFDYYDSQKRWNAFPFSPDDKYSEVLYDDPDDLEEDAKALVERLGMRFRPEYIRREYGDKPIETLRDMVLWLGWMRQHQPPNP
jgi:hypothetical protein